MLLTKMRTHIIIASSLLIASVTPRYLSSKENLQHKSIIAANKQNENIELYQDEFQRESEAVYFADHSFVGKRDTRAQEAAAANQDENGNGEMLSSSSSEVRSFAEVMAQEAAVYFAGHSFIG